MPSDSAALGKAFLKNFSYSSVMIFCLPSALSMPAARIRDRGVEPVEGLGLLLDALLVEHVEHVLHDQGDRVVLGEVVALEQRVEDRLGDEVLGQHLDGVVAGDAVVEVGPQPGEEAVEQLADVEGRVVEQGLDAGDVPVGDDRRCPWPSPPSSGGRRPSARSWRRWRRATRRTSRVRAAPCWLPSPCPLVVTVTGDADDLEVVVAWPGSARSC